MPQKICDLLPGGGVAYTLVGWRLAVAIGVNFVLGALMSVGIGLYAPCMIVVMLLGLHPLAAFPIMMGSCGLVQPTAALQFLRSGRFAFGTSIALTIGSIPGVLLAAFVVKQLPLVWLRWLVVLVVVYASITMLRSFWAGRAEAAHRTRGYRRSMSAASRQASRADPGGCAARSASSSHAAAADTC